MNPSSSEHRLLGRTGVDKNSYTVRKRKLTTVTVIRLVIFFVAVLIAVDLMVGFSLQREVLDIYKHFSFSYTDLLSRNIDGDKAEEYLKTGKTDEYYDAMLSTMQAMVDTAGLRYLYVFVPEDDGIRYIWDAQADDDSRPLRDI